MFAWNVPLVSLIFLRSTGYITWKKKKARGQNYVYCFKNLSLLSIIDKKNTYLTCAIWHIWPRNRHHIDNEYTHHPQQSSMHLCNPLPHMLALRQISLNFLEFYVYEAVHCEIFLSAFFHSAWLFSDTSVLHVSLVKFCFVHCI